MQKKSHFQHIKVEGEWKKFPNKQSDHLKVHNSPPVLNSPQRTLNSAEMDSFITVDSSIPFDAASTEEWDVFVELDPGGSGGSGGGYCTTA